MLTETEPETIDTELIEAVDPEVRKLVKADMDRGEDAELTAASEVEPISDAGLEMATKSLLEMELLMHSHTRVMESASATLATAQATFNRISARMNFATQTETDARMLEYLPRLEAAEDEFLTTMVQIDAQCRAITEATSFSREPQLSSEQMAQANNLRSFVKEDCAELPLSELQVKLQKAAASNDPVQFFLWSRYGQQRMQKPIQGTPYQNDDGVLAHAVTPAMRTSQEQCQTIIKHLTSRLADTRVPKINAEAKQIMQKTRELSRSATARRGQVAFVQQSQHSRYAGL